MRIGKTLPTDPYFGGSVVKFPDGTMVVDPPEFKGTASSKYLIMQDERLDIVAYNRLGDSKRWHEIANLNPDIVINPFEEIPSGTTLLLP